MIIVRFPAVNMFVCIELLRHLTSAAAARPADPALRIIGGRDALANEFPYIVQLFRITNEDNELNNKYTYNTSSDVITYVCTATVLKVTWTLTAHHCIETSQASESGKLKHDFIIRYNSTQDTPSHEDMLSKVLDIVSLPLKRSKKLMFEDIALLEHQPIMITEYGKVSAVDYTALYGHEVKIAGFGLTTNQEVLNLPFAFNMPLQVIDKSMLKKCRTKKAYVTMCAVAACGALTSVCSGDSGGPILHPSGIVGINSKAPIFNNCQLRVRTSFMFSKEIVVITPLSPFMDWISQACKY